MNIGSWSLRASSNPSPPPPPCPVDMCIGNGTDGSKCTVGYIYAYLSIYSTDNTLCSGGSRLELGRPLGGLGWGGGCGVSPKRRGSRVLSQKIFKYRCKW